MDYSSEVLGAINESPIVTDGPLTGPGTPRYETGWYAPKSAFTLGSAAKKHCDGTTLSETEAASLASGFGMVRVDGPSVVGGSIDWNLDPATVPAQDINFDGTQASLEPNIQGSSLNAGTI